MASFSRKTGIVGALVIAGVLVAGSVIITNNGLDFLNPNTANAESTQALLKAYAARDSDNDGLPDWQEALYGLDPNNAHSFSPNMTDGEAVAQNLIKPKFLSQTATSSTDDTTTEIDGITAAPGSLTEQFSQSLLTQYLNQSATDNSNGTQPTDAEITAFAQNAMQTFAKSHQAQDVYALGQVKLSGDTGPDALKNYAAGMEAVFAANNANNGSESEVDYFADAIEKNDPNALAQVAIIGKAYTKIAPDLMQVSVPTEAQYAHLEIANAAARLGSDITDLSMMNSDPLRAYLGLAQYQIDVVSLAKGFVDISSVFMNEKVTLTQGQSGYYFYQTASMAQAANANGGNTQN